MSKNSLGGHPVSSSGGRSKSILLIEDDKELCSLMSDFFARHGFLVEAVHDGHAGLVRSLAGGFDLVILDAMLPLLDGFELLRQLRKQSAIPVIMLTARTTEKDRIAGLNSGADDYLPKPFGPEELLARIRAVLRRTGGGSSARPEVLEAGGVWLNVQTREVRYLNQVVDLTSVEFDILDLLMRSAGRAVSRDELSVALYQRRSSPYDRSLDVHVSHLRKKLVSEGSSLIRTARGIGYMFSA